MRRRREDQFHYCQTTSSLILWANTTIFSSLALIRHKESKAKPLTAHPIPLIFMSFGFLLCWFVIRSPMPLGKGLRKLPHPIILQWRMGMRGSKTIKTQRLKNSSALWTCLVAMLQLWLKRFGYLGVGRLERSGIKQRERGKSRIIYNNISRIIN